MTQLNSPYLTGLQRRWLPAAIAVILLGVMGAILAPPTPPLRLVITPVAVIALVAITYVCLYRAFICRMADRVLLEGNTLRVTRGRDEALIPVSAITGIRDNAAVSPEIIILDLSTETVVGRSVSFIPPARFPRGREHPILEPLRAAMRAG